MNTMIENIKGLLPLLAVVEALGGSYYTTQHRLENLENQTKELSDSISELSSDLEQVSKDLNKLERKLNR